MELPGGFSLWKYFPIPLTLMNGMEETGLNPQAGSKVVKRGRQGNYPGPEGKA